MDDISRLRARLEHLPLELYDTIHDLVFKLPASRHSQDAIFIHDCCQDPPGIQDTVFIDCDYEFPKYLQLNRATRNENARLYYGTTYFVMMDEESGFDFLRTLSAEFRDMLGSFAVRLPGLSDFNLAEHLRFHLKFRREFGDTLKHHQFFSRESSKGREIVRRLRNGYRTPFW